MGLIGGGGSLAPLSQCRVVVTFEATGTGTRMTTVSSFADTEHLDRVTAMGMEEGMSLAQGQIDAILAESR